LAQQRAQVEEEQREQRERQLEREQQEREEARQKVQREQQERDQEEQRQRLLAEQEAQYTEPLETSSGPVRVNFKWSRLPPISRNKTSRTPRTDCLWRENELNFLESASHN